MVDLYAQQKKRYVLLVFIAHFPCLVLTLFLHLFKSELACYVI
jgi:hypothetical protein